MTEQEAKTKPCIGPDPSNTGRMVELPRDEGSFKFLCIGSACMAWRWRDQQSAGVVWPEGSVSWISTGWQTHAQEPHRPAYVGDGWHWDATRACWIAGDQFEDRGYCGLAGKH